MATTEAAKFNNSDLIPIPQPPAFHPEITTISPAHDGLHFWQFMISGSIAGMVEHMSMFPIDTIKTRMQVLGSCPIKSVGLRQALHSILKSDGPAELYQGIGAMGLGAGPAHAVYFSVTQFHEYSTKMKIWIRETYRVIIFYMPYLTINAAACLNSAYREMCVKDVQ